MDTKMMVFVYNSSLVTSLMKLFPSSSVSPLFKSSDKPGIILHKLISLADQKVVFICNRMGKLVMLLKTNDCLEIFKLLDNFNNYLLFSLFPSSKPLANLCISVHPTIL